MYLKTISTQHLDEADGVCWSHGGKAAAVAVAAGF